MAGLHWLPISIFILLPGTFLLSFAIAVGLGHVEAGFPYISDTGTQPPESCIFGQLLNIAAVLVGFSAYVRYRQVAEHLMHQENAHLYRTNVAAFCMALTSAGGISIVGNFQETSVLVVHLLGAVMAFGVGAVYAGLQTYISYTLYPLCGSRAVCHVRACLTALILVTFTMTFLFDGLAKRKLHNGANPRKWFPKDGGFPEHVVSTASEWAMATSLLFFFLSFVSEFRRLRLVPPQIVVIVESVGGLVLENEQIS